MLLNSKKNLFLLFFAFINVMLVFSKPFDLHNDDLSRLLTGKPFYSNSGNHKLIVFLVGLGNIVYLTADSTHDAYGEPTNDVNETIKYLTLNQKELKIDKIPNAKEFLTPGGPFHGEYTHLGWDHPSYAPETSRKWLVRKEILRDFLGKHFNFGLNGNTDFIKPSKRDSFAALLYYVHILGDHEYDTITTARTHIPIKSLDEQDNKKFNIYTNWENNNNNGNGIPTTTILAELNKHLKILFEDQKGLNYYKNLLNIGDYLPDTYNVDNAQDKTQCLGQIQANQRAKAKWILDILFNNVPYLLQNAEFAKAFYKEMLK